MVALEQSTALLLLSAMHFMSGATNVSSDTQYPVYRVVVVGGGLAGLSATLEILSSGLEAVQVVVIEKEANLGGNSARASSGVSGLTESEGDSLEAYGQDTLASGGGRSRPELVSALVVSVLLQLSILDL